MRRLLGLGLVAGIALAAGGATTGVSNALGATSPTPHVLTCAGKVVVRPTSYVLACADANTYFNAIRWTSWGRTAATGTATFVQNDCAPTCAAGKFHKYPAVLTLSAPKSTKLGLLFSVIRYRYTVTASTTLPLTRLSDIAPPPTRPRCSSNPAIAAQYVIPPPPFRVRDIATKQIALPPGEPAGGGPTLKRLYRVSFSVVVGNAVLPAGHRYTQFAYVNRQVTTAAWCFLKGGSGP